MSAIEQNCNGCIDESCCPNLERSTYLHQRESCLNHVITFHVTVSCNLPSTMRSGRIPSTLAIRFRWVMVRVPARYCTVTKYA